jgi:hypothetical protein
MKHAPDHMDAPEFLEHPNSADLSAAAVTATSASTAVAAAPPALGSRPAPSREVARNQKRLAYLTEIKQAAQAMIANPTDELPRSEWTAIEKGYGDLLAVPANALTPDEGLALAREDVTSFRNTRSRNRAARSALAMAWKARNQAAYRVAIETLSPDISGMLEGLSAAEPAAAEAADNGRTNSIEPGALLDKDVRTWVERKWGLQAAQVPARDAAEDVMDVLDDEARSSVADTTSQDPVGTRTQYRRVTPDIEKLLAPVPQNVRRRFFIGEKDHYFFDRKHEKLAFVDKGLRLETQDNSPVVAESFVQIAMARGWDTLKAKGSKDFRREVWLAGELAGAKVIGYDPTEGDRELLERKLEARGVPREEAAQRAHVELNTVEPGFEKGMTVEAGARGKGKAAGAPKDFAFDEEEAVLVAPDGTRFDQADMLRMERPAKGTFKEDSAEFFRWYEYGGVARERPLDAAELATVLVERGYSLEEAEDRVQRDSYAHPDDRAIWRAVSAFRQKETQVKATAADQGEIVRTHNGKLVEHGPAPFDFNKENGENYYVRLEQDGGKTRDVWGKGLAEAMDLSHAEVGDVVSLKKVSAKPVTVQEAVRNDDGKITGYRTKESVLNGWLVEKAQDFRTLAPEHSLAKHPDLIDAHATMATTAAALANRYPNVAGAIKEKFRDGLAEKIQRGETIKAPRVAATKAAARGPEAARTAVREQEQER